MVKLIKKTAMSDLVCGYRNNLIEVYPARFWITIMNVAGNLIFNKLLTLSLSICLLATLMRFSKITSKNDTDH